MKNKNEQENYPICLSENEKNFLISQIKNTKNYLEFGAGGSTFLALKETKAKKITSVESDEKWIEHLKNWKEITDNINNRLKFIHVNIGKTGDWGVPIEDNKKHLFSNYSSAPFEQSSNYDVGFVDGRFRVACALKTILNCDKSCKILMHDFTNRPQYHCILQFLDIVDTVETMALFKIKDNYDKIKLSEMVEKYNYIYS